MHNTFFEIQDGGHVLYAKSKFKAFPSRFAFEFWLNLVQKKNIQLSCTVSKIKYFCLSSAAVCSLECSYILGIFKPRALKKGVLVKKELMYVPLASGIRTDGTFISQLEHAFCMP